MQNLNDEMISLANGAVEVMAKNYGVNLDFSVESIKLTEEVLNSLHNEVSKSFIRKILKRSLTESQISMAALMIGAYIGEVIRRAHGGEWFKQDILDEKDVISLRIGDNSIFPIAKAYKRIKNGSEDNVWFYYEVLVKEIVYKEKTEEQESL